MRHLLFSLFLIAAASSVQAVFAQKIVEKSADIAAGQRVFLNLKQGGNIRIRAGAGRKMLVKATVSVNQNRLNDALKFDLATSAAEVKLTADFDKEMLRDARPGDCPDAPAGGRNVWFGQEVCTEISYDITLPADVALRVYSYSANVDIAGLSGAMEVKSLSGFVDVTWPDNQGAELALKTITGEVYTDQDIAFSTEPRKNPIVGYLVKGTLRGSGPLVRLESISNDVYFRKRL
ncbi:hypothetical protein [Hymenobacter sp. IS2118]|uniref:hypothetical protein n=1 Tax=Hymenobacter sp. IS2118 TaxID=1505605 RepID=UPI000557E448|nr:hypothetical protein [Hymenobacter sp. IS2118]